MTEETSWTEDQKNFISNIGRPSDERPALFFLKPFLIFVVDVWGISGLKWPQSVKWAFLLPKGSMPCVVECINIGMLCVQLSGRGDDSKQVDICSANKTGGSNNSQPQHTAAITDPPLHLDLALSPRYMFSMTCMQNPFCFLQNKNKNKKT